MEEHPVSKNTPEIDRTSQIAAVIWLLVGVACPFLFLLLTPMGKLEIPLAPFMVYLLSVLGLDLFVGASRSEVSLQRITPAVILGLLLTPGIPRSLALMVDLAGMISVALTSRINYHLLAQSGKALLPASLTAFYLYSLKEMTPNSFFLACWIFIVASLVTRTDRPPFRSDVFLIVCYPAVALLLRYLTEVHWSYLVLSVPLLFLLTTVNAETLMRYFQLKEKLDQRQSEILESKRAQRQTELESRRKGILLLRKEGQLSLLNGLGREMDKAEGAEDLASFLLRESVRMTEAETSLLLFSDPDSGEILRIVSPLPSNYWGVKEGERLPKSVAPGITDKEPWFGPIWRGKQAFLTCKLGHEGWLFMAKAERGSFPDFLEGFFAAVGRHAGSAVLAMRRLTEVRETARREAQEKKNVAAEKEKVAEQNRKLRLLLESFEGLAEGTLATTEDLFEEAVSALKKMTGSDEVVFRAQPLETYPRNAAGIQARGTSWASHLYCPGSGPSGSVLCLSKKPDALSSGQLEWCHLLQDFLDKTLENTNLQQEVVVSSQWAAAGRLAANAAHELNTPLGAIRIAAEHISMHLQYGGDPAPAVESMGSLMSAVDRCRRVTDRLLITSRPADKGPQSSKPQFQSLAPILKDGVDSVRPYLRASKIRLVEPKPLPEIQVLAVMQDLYWALVNVLKNGIDAINEVNPPDKTIVLKVEEADGEVRISVQDNGPGVPEEVRKRLFEPFFTTKKLGQGNGLGLSLSRGNLRRWGGTIEFVDTPGGGATFVMKVPTCIESERGHHGG